jgi:hypothetical protein
MEVSISFTPRPLYPQGKSPWYPLDRRLGGPQSHNRTSFIYKDAAAAADDDDDDDDYVSQMFPT